MGFYLNSTNIPNNVQNAININGINITKIVGINGIVLYEQSTINISGWSGSSLGSTRYGNMGLQMSGRSFRAWWASSSYGSWVSINSSTGQFSGNSSNGGYQVISSGSNLTMGSGWVYYNPSTKKFSGSTTSTSSDIAGKTSHMNTSSGKVRWYNTYFGVYNAYVLLQ